jgi:hypothetical protein
MLLPSLPSEIKRRCTPSSNAGYSRRPNSEGITDRLCSLRDVRGMGMHTETEPHSPLHDRAQISMAEPC